MFACVDLARAHLVAAVAVDSRMFRCLQSAVCCCCYCLSLPIPCIFLAKVVVVVVVVLVVMVMVA